MHTALPACMQVFERGWLSSNNILFQADAHCALVDSGYVSHAPQTLALVQHALAGRKLDCIINTHLHSDHCGGNALLQQTYACRTLIAQAEHAAVAAWDMQALTFAATGQACVPFVADGGLSDGEVLRLGELDWRVIAAPGHDPHALMLYCATDGILISADALWQDGFGVIFPELKGESGFAEQAAVLATIAELDLRIVIPGHGSPFGDVAAALARARSRLDYLWSQPQRNARHALKALLAFLLLDRRQISLNQVRLLIETSVLMQAAASLLEAPMPALIKQLAQELCKSGVARLEGECLLAAT